MNYSLSCVGPVGTNIFYISSCVIRSCIVQWTCSSLFNSIWKGADNTYNITTLSIKGPARISLEEYTHFLVVFSLFSSMFSLLFKKKSLLKSPWCFLALDVNFKVAREEKTMSTNVSPKVHLVKWKWSIIVHIRLACCFWIYIANEWESVSKAIKDTLFTYNHRNVFIIHARGQNEFCVFFFPLLCVMVLQNVLAKNCPS